MYYLRTKSAVDAIKFTLDTKAEVETKKEAKAKQEVVEPAVEVKPEVVASKKKAAVKTAQKFAETKDVDVEPMSAEEMKQLIAQSKDGQGDDCLMCGS
jgi:ribonucleoside-diphosphate reductase alpha chain